MVCVDVGGGIGAEMLEKNNKWLNNRNEKKDTYSAKYQAPTTLEHVVLIIPLATAQLQSQMADVPTMAQLAQAFKCHSQPPVVPSSFVA
jgi:hypothetical protein